MTDSPEKPASLSPESQRFSVDERMDIVLDAWKDLPEAFFAAHAGKDVDDFNDALYLAKDAEDATRIFRDLLLIELERFEAGQE